MSYISQDEIRGILIQTGSERVLLPNAVVAEVMSRVSVESLTDVPSWLVGRIVWYGWKVPLVSFARFIGLDEEVTADSNKVILMKALGCHADLPYFALLTGSFPQLISVSRDSLLADASEEILPQGVHMRVLLSETQALLPNLDTIEDALRLTCVHNLNSDGTTFNMGGMP
ncbi:chemotaxis protein CheW [Xylella taiwanensis]|uniref:Chemotaxis protein CheW n=1 Tax=Xylella taiwanensis TaxID=1444770 RepID=Z9JH78_9GAMM|nr:chemotaxis protein CheW [Xylella taiwanensis]AXI83620.1 chemotaxis protein CheW [Xylella taiwanensis]EWS77770.1 chemotaxis protein CheW [Xylella taiwanensis]MCD8456704.1 chemotaxis protein CheW [Xylella taiwanensis]MCD8459111.1 chemotaxis protein CheW [Xylella taiwanensis]MCD8461995.1 chemotaxis protein CheW [Xylella taiwanensis]